MPFIGNQPALSYTSFAKQDFTTSATTSYTLDNPVTNENELALFINFVRQEPTTAYTASGTSLTLTSATSASDDMYCVFLGKAVQTVNPPNGSVGASQIADSSIALGKLSATGTKDATTFLRGDNTFASAGGDNTPAFLAYANADQGSIPSNTYTKLTNYGVEVFDTDNKFSSNRFTPGVVGKYFIYGTAYLQHYGAQRSWVAVYKNGSIYTASSDMPDSAAGFPIQVSAIVDMTNTTDYVEIYARQQGTGTTAYSSGVSVTFGGYKLIT
nr:c1q globular head like domain containing protein [uncultured Mediterranean phage uvMED]